MTCVVLLDRQPIACRMPLRMASVHFRETACAALKHQYLATDVLFALHLSTSGYRRFLCRFQPAIGTFATLTSQRHIDNSSLHLSKTKNQPVRTDPFAVAPIHILSTSPNASSDSLLIRFLRWLRKLWRRCQDTAFMLTRGSEVILRFSPLIVLAPTSMLMAKCSMLWSSSDDRTNAMSDWTWDYTRSAITALGPAFVKLFQWVATRRDIFPPNLCNRLGVLHDRGVPHAWKDSETVLTQTFGQNYKERGLCIDPNAVIGCGSAAQVYKGMLRTEDGVNHPVAVKVLHPLLRDRVLRDLHFVRTVAEFVHSLPSDLIKMLNLPRAVENFGSILLRQTDLRIEAENLIQFRQNFYRSKRDESDSVICFPKPFEGWIGSCVLVEDLVHDAKPISEFLSDSTVEGIKIRKELASPLLRAFLKMVFLDNFVHCDLHAGNVLIQTMTVERSRTFWQSVFPSSKEAVEHETKRQIVFLDAGIAMSLNPNDQRNLLDLFRAVLLNNGDQAGRLMVARAQYERCSQTPGGVDSFARGIEELVNEFHVRRKEGLTLGSVRIGSLLGRVLDLCRLHGVEIDPNMSSIVVSTLVLEGLGRSLDPKLNLLDFALPFVVAGGRV